MADFNVVIVNFCSLHDARACILSLQAHGICSPSDIIVVDNCSPDGSGHRLASLFPEIQVVLAPRNGGFGYGVNQGIQRSTAELTLVLNPDTRFCENRLNLAVREFRSDPTLGILGLNLINPDGSPQYSARTHYSLVLVLLRRTFLGRIPLFSRVMDSHVMKQSWSQPVFDADWVLGTGLMIRRNAFLDIGGMDESYFLYMEDVDLCLRMALAGWRVRAISEVRLVHDHRRASASSLFSSAWITHLRALARFARKFGMPLFHSPDLPSIRRRLHPPQVPSRNPGRS